MTTHEFYKTVRQMREAQKAWFATRNPAKREEAQRLAERVDAELARIASVESGHAQLELFRDPATAQRNAHHPWSL